MRQIWQDPIRRRRLKLLARAALLVTLLILMLVTWWPSVMAILHTNLGSLALNRAFLNPDATPEDRVAYAVQAGERFRAALAWDLLYGPAYYNLAATYASWGDSRSATETLARAAALMPRDAVAQVRYGLALAERGQEAEALEVWRSATGAATYFTQRGEVLSERGDLEGALQQYQRAVAIDPGGAEAQMRLGQVLSRLGRKEEALEAFAAAAEADRGSSDRPHLLQAEIHRARGEWTAALAAYRDAAGLSPEDPEPHYRRGWLLSEKLGEDDAALAAFQDALHVDPDHDPSRRALGLLQAKRGACDAAAQWLDPLLERSVDSGSAVREDAALAGELHVALGACWLEQGREQEAFVHLERAHALGSDDVRVLVPLADAYARGGRFEQAIDIYRRVLTLAPDNAEARQALEDLGWSEMGEGQ